MGLYYGYIRSDLVSHGVIKENNTGYASWAGIVKSTTGTVNIRSGAGTGASIVKALKMEMVLKLLAQPMEQMAMYGIR